MAQMSFDTPEFKRVLKEALSETLSEQRELVYEVFFEVLEDVGSPKLFEKDYALSKPIVPLLLAPWRRTREDDFPAAS